MRPFNVFLMIVITIGLVALLVWTQEKRKSTQIWVWVGTALILTIAKAFSPDDIGPSSWADVADWIMPDGYVQHSVETSISMQDDWIIGETKECVSAALDFRTAQHLGEEPGYVAPSIACDNKGTEHSVTVKLYRRLNQPEHFLVYWRCTRESESFICRQTGAD